MSLPDTPNTLREKYYSVMAGQNDADILPDIETAPSTENRYLDYIARNGGGGGGDVTKAYVDEQDAKKTDKVTSAISGNFAGLDSNGNLTDSNKSAADFATASDMSDVQGVIPSTATTSNKLATAADVTGEDISATSTTSPLTDSADGFVQGVTIYGQSEVVEGEIKSVGDDGLTVTTCGKNMFNPSVYSEYLQQDGTYRCVPGALTNISTSVKSYIGKTLTFSAYLSRDGNYPTSMRVSATINGVIMSGTLVNANTYTRSTLTFTPRTENDIINITYGTSGSAEYIFFKDVQLEFGSTATAYEPYNDTMATFTTALPLRGVSDTVRDKLTCTAESKQVETVCGDVDLGTLTYTYTSSDGQPCFQAQISGIKRSDSATTYPYVFSAMYSKEIWNKNRTDSTADMTIAVAAWNDFISIRNSNYTDAATFKAAMSGVMLVYELATPTVTPLTDAEIAAFRSLRTFDNTTNITITDEPEFEFDYLKNTENGQTVAGIQTDLQEQIDDKITISPLLTLTVAGWDSTTLQQTVTFVHDTTKRNVIDVDPASVEEWAACGIIARYETASNITATCKSIPENALLFKVTSMGV